VASTIPAYCSTVSSGISSGAGTTGSASGLLSSTPIKNLMSGSLSPKSSGNLLRKRRITPMTQSLRVPYVLVSVVELWCMLVLTHISCSLSKQRQLLVQECLSHSFELSWIRHVPMWLLHTSNVVSNAVFLRASK